MRGEWGEKVGRGAGERGVGRNAGRVGRDETGGEQEREMRRVLPAAPTGSTPPHV
jgi:hypothetical protein